MARRYRRNDPDPGRRRRRRFRRNPRGGIVGQAMHVLQGGVGVVAGKVVARQATSLLKLDPASPIGIAGQLGVALVAGMIATRQLKLRGPFADGLVYGAAAGAAESAIRLIMPGAAGKLLGEYDEGIGAYELSAYPTGALLGSDGVDREQSALVGAYGVGLM